MSEISTVDVYWRPGCPYCAQLLRGLTIAAAAPVSWWAVTRGAGRRHARRIDGH
jgi:hypothetical protein